MTGVLNRHGLTVAGSQELDRIRREGQSVTVVFADMDNFKEINDRYGHECGDEALKQVSEMLQSAFGPSAVIARYGGDEFVAILGGLTGCLQARALAMGFLESVKDETLDAGGEKIGASMSIGGIWCGRLPESMELATLVGAADELMYQAKGDTSHGVNVRELAV